MEQMWFTAASWLGLALAASLISIRKACRWPWWRFF